MRCVVHIVTCRGISFNKPDQLHGRDSVAGIMFFSDFCDAAIDGRIGDASIALEALLRRLKAVESQLEVTIGKTLAGNVQNLVKTACSEAGVTYKFDTTQPALAT